jgi:peptide methionine sulfoxide reductase MsrA
MKGVKEAVPDYIGEQLINSSYKSLETGPKGHPETVNVYYAEAAQLIIAVLRN